MPFANIGEGILPWSLRPSRDRQRRIPGESLSLRQLEERIYLAKIFGLQNELDQ